VSMPYVGEIRMGGWNFAPVGWAMCNGQLLPIDQNPVLFQLVGTIYGGDGMSTFGLPDLRGRLPVHAGPGLTLGQQGGSETVTLTSNQVPGHSHTFMCSTSDGTQHDPGTFVPATLPGGSAYIQGTATTPLAAGSIQSGTGGGQPHDNMQPYLCITFIISLFGVFPSQS
jgi:microcystin-dependent protein